MMHNKTLPLIALIMATFSARDVHAEVYKWVDKNGVTNYSEGAPKDARAAKKVEVVEQRISVYAPAAVVTPAIAAALPQADRTASEKIDSLQRQLDAERLARQNAVAAEHKAAQAAHDRCVAERRVDCDAVYHPNAQPTAQIVVIGRARRPAPFVPTVPLHGVTAGNVTNAIAATGASVNRTPGASR